MYVSCFAIIKVSCILPSFRPLVVKTGIVSTYFAPVATETVDTDARVDVHTRQEADSIVQTREAQARVRGFWNRRALLKGMFVHGKQKTHWADEGVDLM